MGLVGKPAYDFELPDSNGAVHRMSDDLGHWQWLVFHRHLG